MLLHKTVRQLLNPDLGMRRTPILQHHVILEHSMSGRPVLRLIHKLQRNSLPRVIRDHKAHRIAVALLRQPGTQFRITEIAAFKFLMIERRVLVSRSRARSAPSRPTAASPDAATPDRQPVRSAQKMDKPKSLLPKRRFRMIVS